MALEKKESHDESFVDELTKLESASEEVKKEEIKVVEDTPEQKEQKERSNLGRKVKKLEETLESMNEALQELRQSRQSQLTHNDSDLPEYVSTPDDVERILTAREKKQREEKDKYQNVYAKTFRSVGSDDPDYQEVFDEMFEHFNVVRTGKADIDAELNYAKAKASVLSKRTAPVKVKANVKGEKPVASTNLSVDSRASDAPIADVELDEFAKEFIAKTGMKVESQRDALKGDAPIHLRK